MGDTTGRADLLLGEATMSTLLSLFSAASRAATFLSAGVLLTLPGTVAAQGDLLVAPTRVVINGGGGAEIVLSNIGAEAATYRIGLELRRMTPEGDLEDIDPAAATPEQQAMLAMFRYAPRRISLPPNQPQAVRISARPPADLPDGEYRVHMSFHAIPATQSVEAPRSASEDEGFSIKLTPIYGVTIPLILRKGQLTGGAVLSNPAVVTEGGVTYLKLGLARTGNRSLYGEIRVVSAGSKEPAFLVRGVAIYPEVTSRTLRLALPAQAAALRGPVQIEYRELPEVGGRLITSIPATL